MADDTPSPSEDAPVSPPPPSRAETQPTEPTPPPAVENGPDEEDLAAGSELLEEEEPPEEPVVNIPLAMAFLLGGVGFLMVFGLNASRGMSVLLALGWASAFFVAVTIAGFLIDVLLTRYRTVIIQPVEIIEEPEDPDAEETDDQPGDPTPPATTPTPESDATPPQPGPD